MAAHHCAFHCSTIDLRSAFPARVALLIALAACLTACGDSPAPSADNQAVEPPPAGVVARHAEITITQDELDKHILALPAARRPKPGEDLDTWYRQQIREMLVTRRLHKEAAQSDIEQQPGFAARRMAVERQFVIASCLRKRAADREPPTLEQLQQAYQARKQAFVAPERRAAFHIFQRNQDPSDAAETLKRIESLRTRTLNGENFKRLATRHSDSESRHREGTLGWIEPGMLPKGFEQAIFSLQEGVPSEPVMTRDGAHIFFVDTILPARELSLSEARPALREALQQERVRQDIVDITAGMDDPLGLPSRERFVEITRNREADAVLLSDGDYTVTLNDLRAQLRQAFARSDRTGKAPETLSLETSWRFLGELRTRALAYRQCRQLGVVAQAKIDEALQKWRDEVLIVNQRSRRLLELARTDPAALRSHYENNIGRFTSAPLWDLRRLVIPLGDSASKTLPRLEQAASRGDIGLDSLQSELGGEVESLGSLSLAALGLMQPKLPALIAPLSSGKLSPPYRNGQNLEIVEVISRQEPVPLPFDEVLDRVAADFVDQNTPQLYERLVDDVLVSGPVEIFEEPLAALKEAGLQQPEISVEELERMLEGL